MLGRAHTGDWVLGAWASGVATRERMQSNSKARIWQVGGQREEHVGIVPVCDEVREPCHVTMTFLTGLRA